MLGSAPKNYKDVTDLLFPLTRHPGGITGLARHVKWQDLWTVPHSNIYDAFKDGWPEQNVLKLPRNHSELWIWQCELPHGENKRIQYAFLSPSCFGNRLLVPVEPRKKVLSFILDNKAFCKQKEKAVLMSRLIQPIPSQCVRLWAECGNTET